MKEEVKVIDFKTGKEIKYRNRSVKSEIYDAVSFYEYEELKQFFSSEFYKEPKSLFFKQKKRNQQVYGREYLDFLVQKEKEYRLLYDYLLSIIYECEFYLGNILELNGGVDDSVAVLDDGNELDITLVSLFADYKLLGEQDFYYAKGYISSLKYDVEGEEKKELLIKMLENKKMLNLKDFETILCLNPHKASEILDIYEYARKKNKNVIAGYTTNLYDKLEDYKMDIMVNACDILRPKYGDDIYVSEQIKDGAKMRVLTHFKY